MESISAQGLMMEIIKGKNEEQLKRKFNEWVKHQRLSTEILLPPIQTHDLDGNCWITVFHRHHGDN